MRGLFPRIKESLVAQSVVSLNLALADAAGTSRLQNAMVLCLLISANENVWDDYTLRRIKLLAK